MPAPIVVPGVTDRLGLEVSVGTCPADLPGAVRADRWLQVRQGAALVQMPEWRMLVTGGREVLVEPIAGDGVVSWAVDSWAVSLAMMQRGMPVLHATLVGVDGRAVAIAGASGAGKSTSAMELAARGHRLLTDDVVIVELRDGVPWALPFRRRVHLMHDAAHALGVARDSQPMAGVPGKATLEVADPGSGPVPLDAVFVLSITGDRVMRTRLSGVLSVAALTAGAGRPSTGRAILGPHRHHELMAAIASGTEVWAVARPAEGWSVGAVADAVEAVAGADSVSP